MKDGDNPMVFCVKCQCGGACFLSVDTPEAKKENAKEIARIIRKGFTVTTITLAESHALPWCSCKKSKPV